MHLDQKRTDLERPISGKKSILLTIVGLAAFLVYIIYFVDVSQMITILRMTDPTYYLLSFVLLSLSMFFYSFTWRSFLGMMSIHISIKKAWTFVWIGSFIDLLIPTESFTGEVSRVYFAAAELKASTGKIVASVFSHRILSSILNLMGLILGSLILLLRNQLGTLISEIILIVSLGTTASIVVFFLISLKEDVTMKIINFFLKISSSIFKGRLNLERYRDSIFKGLISFHEGIRILGSSPKGLIGPVLYALIAWLLDLGVLFSVFYSIGYQSSFSLLLVIYSLMHTIQMIPIGIPGVVGITEITMTTFLTLLGVPAAFSVVITVLARFVTFWSRLIVGYVHFQFLGLKTKS